MPFLLAILFYVILAIYEKYNDEKEYKEYQEEMKRRGLKWLN